jgi:hypothetical protein
MSFKRHFEQEEFLFIAKDVMGTAEFLSSRLKALGLDSAKILMLDKPTAGQAETVEFGLRRTMVSGTEPILIFNIDTIRPGFDLGTENTDAGWLEVFQATGENWSFVDPDPINAGLAIRCTEKQRVSDLCCTGMYYFRESSLFLEALSAERKSPSAHELFVAPLYNHLIQAGHRISWREVPANRIILAGVPAEYEAISGRGFMEALEW